MASISQKQLTVGELIALLEGVAGGMNADAEVYFDFCGRFPSGLGSYRGFYEDLTIHHAGRDEGEKKPPSVKDFIASLKAKLGTTIHGYKGGDYTVTKDTATWVDNSGECFGTYVSGVNAREPWRLVLKTRYTTT